MTLTAHPIYSVFSYIVRVRLLILVEQGAGAKGLLVERSVFVVLPEASDHEFYFLSPPARM